MFIQESGVCGIQSETLYLVECALKYPEYTDILDLGTGTGYIGIILDDNDFKVDAVDNDDKALENAATNIAKFRSGVNLFKSDLFSSVTNCYDLIIFNPPVNPNENQFTKYISSFLRKISFFREVLIPIIRLKYLKARKEFILQFLEEAKKYINFNGAILMHLTKDDIKWLSLCENINYAIVMSISLNDFIVLFKPDSLCRES